MREEWGVEGAATSGPSPQVPTVPSGGKDGELGLWERLALESAAMLDGQQPCTLAKCEQRACPRERCVGAPALKGAGSPAQACLLGTGGLGTEALRRATGLLRTVLWCGGRRSCSSPNT